MRQYTRISTAVSHTFTVPTITLPSQYPSEWFAAHQGEKPTATFRKGVVTDDTLYGSVKKGIEASSLSVETVKYFLYKFFKDKCKAKLPDDWKSFGVNIGLKDNVITPWDIITVREEEGTVSGAQTGTYTEGDEYWMAFVCLCASRLAEPLREDYAGTLKAKILLHINGKGAARPQFPPADLYKTWNQDDSYRIMVAAIDMYLTRFITDELSVYRVCTLRSRYRDCSAFVSVGFISHLLNLDEDTDWLDWLWTSKVADEADAMMKLNQEVVENYSYFPYQTDLKLVQKTYYSAAKNPHNYFLIHAVGALLGSTRSINARFFSDQNVANNIQCAKIIAYAFSHSFNIDKMYKLPSAPDPNKLDGDEVDDDPEPSKPTGASWFSYMAAHDFKLTPRMFEWVNRAKESINEPREGSIGMYVKHHF